MSISMSKWKDELKGGESRKGRLAVKSQDSHLGTVRCVLFLRNPSDPGALLSVWAGGRHWEGSVEGGHLKSRLGLITSRRLLVGRRSLKLISRDIWCAGEMDRDSGKTPRDVSGNEQEHLASRTSSVQPALAAVPSQLRHRTCVSPGT